MSWDAKKVKKESGSVQSRQRKHPQKRKKRGPGVVYYLVILVISAILAGVAWLMCNDLLALNEEEHSAEIVVEEGDKLGKIASELKKADLIDFKGLFLLYGAVSDTEVVPGNYTLNTEMDYNALLTAMSKRSGSRTTVNVTIPEGYSMKQIFKLLEEKNVNTVADLTARHQQTLNMIFLQKKSWAMHPDWRVICSRIPISSIAAVIPKMF